MCNQNTRGKYDRYEPPRYMAGPIEFMSPPTHTRDELSFRSLPEMIQMQGGAVEVLIKAFWAIRVSNVYKRKSPRAGVSARVTRAAMWLGSLRVVRLLPARVPPCPPTASISSERRADCTARPRGHGCHRNITSHRDRV